MKSSAYKRPDLKKKKPQQIINEEFKQAFQWTPHR
jgi:hypothetical protein